jgi:hypothetical protein
MLDDVTMPDVEPGQIEQHPDAGNLVGIGDCRVFEPSLPTLRRPGQIAKLLALLDLKLHFVNVERMRVLGEVVDLPNLHAIERRGIPCGCPVFIIPFLAQAADAVDTLLESSRGA